MDEKMAVKMVAMMVGLKDQMLVDKKGVIMAVKMVALMVV